MKPARIVLLVVAILAGGLAAFLAMRGDNRPPVEVAQRAPEPVAQTQVLVAKQTIGVGQRLNAQMVEWQNWPENAVRPEYITTQNLPDAPDQMAGTLARFEIFEGEPIRDSKLVRSNQGYLSAVLAPGMRGVSIPVTASSGAGGFIVPNDRVDLVHTRVTEGAQYSETILRNVKVLAIGLRLGERGASAGPKDEQDPQTQVFQNSTIATLELDQVRAERVISAVSTGQISLVLRSIVDFSEPVDPSGVQQNGQTVRMIGYGVSRTVVPGRAPLAPATPAGDAAGGGADGAPAPAQTPVFSLLNPPPPPVPAPPPPVTQ